MTMRAKRYQNFAALPYFYAPHHPPLKPLNLLNPPNLFARNQGMTHPMGYPRTITRIYH